MSRKLPPRMHKKGPSYYHVADNHWQRLGRDFEQAMTRYWEIESTGIHGAGRFKFEDLTQHCVKLFYGCKSNAQNRNIEFSLTRDEVPLMLDRSKFRCEISGIPFSLETHAESGKRPYAPSIDRIDSSGPYRFSNVRLVLWAVNAGMQDWGLEVYLHVAKHAAQRVSELPSYYELDARLQERDKAVFLSRR